jgi:arylsulfatase A-like enzyme
MLCDKGRLYKTVFYEESANVPFIVRPPGYDKGGAVCSRLVSQIDAVPTILELAGCETTSGGFGKSLMPLLEDPEAEHRDAVFSEFGFRTMIRDERYKMVVNSAGEVLKLYDMGEDPEENVNLVGGEGTEETVTYLRDRMLDWLLETQLTQGRTRY